MRILEQIHPTAGEVSAAVSGPFEHPLELVRILSAEQFWHPRAFVFDWRYFVSGPPEGTIHVSGRTLGSHSTFDDRSQTRLIS